MKTNTVYDKLDSTTEKIYNLVTEYAMYMSKWTFDKHRNSAESKNDFLKAAGNEWKDLQADTDEIRGRIRAELQGLVWCDD